MIDPYTNTPPGTTSRDCEGPEMVECKNCDGDGKIVDDGAPDAVPVECPKCSGTGLVTKDEQDSQ